MRRWMMSVLLATAVAVVGCDGGDGDSGDAVDESESLLSLTASNAETVSGEVLDSWGEALGLPVLAIYFNPVNPTLFSAVFGFADDSLSVSSGLTVASASTVTGSAVPLTLPPVPLRQIPSGANTLTIQATISETVACPAGGTVQYNGAITSADRLTVGDTLTSLYTNCMLSELEGPINGSVGSTITEVSGDPTLRSVPYGFRVESEFSALSETTSDSETYWLNGDVAWREASQDGIVFQDSVEIQGITLALSGASDPADNGSATLSSYRAAIAVNVANPDLIGYSADGGGTVASTDIGGTVTYDVLRDLVGFAGVGVTDYPESGSVEIRGGYNSSILLTALSDTLVQLDVDQSGDGISDATLVLNWTELLPDGLLLSP